MAVTRGKGRSAPQRRTQSERSQTTQRNIIESAMRLLQDVGYQETSLQEIARGAGVTLGAVQHHFGSRQALMERIVDEVMAPLSSVVTVWPDETTRRPLEERAQEFVRSAWTNVYGNPSYTAAWSLFFGCKATPLFERINEHRSENDPVFFAHFIQVFPEVSQRHAAPEAFAATVFAALRGLAVMRLFDSNDSAEDQHLDVIAQIIVSAGS